MDLPREHHWLASALDGDAEALRRCAELPPAYLALHRVAPALALRAGQEVQHPGVEDWRHQLRATAGRQMLLEPALQGASEALAAAGITWLPFKGCDLASRLYRRPEERPYADLDLLIASADLEPARAALVAAGWRPLRRGRLHDRYLEREGYAWQAVDERQVLLEVHFRLWGLMPAGSTEELIARAGPAADLGATARRLRLADAFVLAAVHLWLESPPRAVGRFWELERLASRLGEGLVAPATELSTTFDVQLPVALAARIAAELWVSEPCMALAERLQPTLRAAERRMLERSTAAGRDPTVLSLSRIALARLLAGRASRSGGRGLWRQVWPHPALVEQATSSEWSWLRRRWTHQRRVWFGRATGR